MNIETHTIIETSSGPAILADDGTVVLSTDSAGIAAIAKVAPDIANALADRLRKDIAEMNTVAATLKFPSEGKVSAETWAALNAGTSSGDGLRFIAEAITRNAPEEADA